MAGDVTPLQQILGSPWAAVPLRILRAALPGLQRPMPSHFAAEAILGLGPVLLYIAGLLYLDSFKIVRLHTIVGVMLLGMIAALASYYIGGQIIDLTQMPFIQYSRYWAPVVEEGFKAAMIVLLFWRNRIGFMIDAAILGLAAGAGFSIAENLYYAWIFPEANVGVWVVRGLGTALMHAGATAIFALVAQRMRERHSETGWMGYLPGYLFAVSLHSIFNQFTAWPLASTAGTILALPLVLLFLFDKSEHEVHDWLVHDYESHEHLLEDIKSGKFEHSEAGRFITTLAGRFSKKIVALIFAYIRIHTELVLKAEALLLEKEEGKKVKPSAEVKEKFARLHALERAIGRSALLVIWPHLKFSRQELFELHELEQES